MNSKLLYFVDDESLVWTAKFSDGEWLCRKHGGCEVRIADHGKYKTIEFISLLNELVGEFQVWENLIDLAVAIEGREIRDILNK